ncbi:tetratricopeptide repeat protein [Streptomyces bullii]|uniref:Tetratricopeptide repeat protein n=1 Tax=Streptomyces bullii TaxID=349910 RepID=A0ABW0UW10_9ACTN
MPPRTNDSASERRHGEEPAAGPGPEAGSSPGSGASGSGASGSDAPAPVTSEQGTPAPEAGAPKSQTSQHGTPAPESGAPESGAPESETSVQGTPTPRTPESGTGADADAEAEAVGGGAPDGDQRVAAVRRVAAAGRRWRAGRLAGCAALLAVALTAGAVAAGGLRDSRGATVAASPAGGALAPGTLAGGDLDAGIRSLQAHLRAQPRDFSGWATLGLAYVEQARTKGDPSRYPQAQRALRRSLTLRPGNDQALAGRAALAAARHDFTGALTHADRALKQNPYNERALSSRVDALVELGRYEEAAEAADTADSRRPGVPVFTRYAYVRELRGDVRTARRVLEQALAGAASPADVAYVATALGQLAWNQGDYDTALRHYARALAADEDHLPALEGRARAQAASGDRAAAIEALEHVVTRSPLPGPLVALGELYEARDAEGDRARARDQYALVDAWTALARAGGVNADLDTALAAADHGDVKEALRAARAEWQRRHSVHTADALAWALHVNGRSEEALPYARRATATGYRNAVFLYHRGMIERAAGQEREARDHLRAALRLNPGFSPLGARDARAALQDLEASR